MAALRLRYSEPLEIPMEFVAEAGGEALLGRFDLDGVAARAPDPGGPARAVDHAALNRRWAVFEAGSMPSVAEFMARDKSAAEEAAMSVPARSSISEDRSGMRDAREHLLNGWAISGVALDGRATTYLESKVRQSVALGPLLSRFLDCVGGSIMDVVAGGVRSGSGVRIQPG